MAHRVQDEEDFRKRLEEAGNKLVIVCFSATNCNLCNGIEETLTNLSENFQQCSFLQIDADETDVADNLEVEEFPTFHFYREGQRIGGHHVRGAGNEEMVEITKIINQETE